jgi:hypothetical protein
MMRGLNEADLCNIPLRNITRAPQKRPSLSIIGPEVTTIGRDCYFRENIAKISEQMCFVSRRQVTFSSLKKKMIEGAHVRTVLQRLRIC